MLDDHNLVPADALDHFRKANVLHQYTREHLNSAVKFALQAGQELLLAKEATPHASWGTQCEKLFDGSARTAQFYMQFASDIEKLPKAQATALLTSESSLERAAKAAKTAARPPKEKPAKVPWDSGEEPRTGKSVPEKHFDRSYWWKQWDSTIAPLVRLLNRIGDDVGECNCKHHLMAREALRNATNEIMAWMEVNND